MSEINQRQIPEKKRRKRSISPKVVQALEHLASGRARTQCDAAAMASISPEWLSKMLKRPEIGVLIDEMCRKFLRTGKVRATGRLIELLEHNSGRVSLEASRLVLGIGGIAPPQQGVNVNLDVNMPCGYVIDLSGGDRRAPPMLDITPNAEHPSAEPFAAALVPSRGYER